MSTPSQQTATTNPFPGLRPFNEEEEHLFFGRESQVDALVDSLAKTRFLAVVGTSGSGKSSLVNCGLRPALRRGLMPSAGTAWRIAQFRPGGDPIHALALALARKGVLFPDSAVEAVPRIDVILATLHLGRRGLIDIFEQARLPDDVNLLVVVDQFEELFRYRGTGTVQDDAVLSPMECAEFVNLLLQAHESSSGRIFIALTMRSDFLGDCAEFEGLPEAINAGQYLVPRMTREERRTAITGPILVSGGEISPVLLTRLVNDVGDNPDQLSILQHALNRTWARWQFEGGAGAMDLGHYETIGTMAHALDQHAERAFGELTDERARALCERMFRALTDKATDARGVRRPTAMGPLCGICAASLEEMLQVMAVFRKPSRSFLMPPQGDDVDQDTVIDISHESLMRVWNRLSKWANEEARSARTYRRLAETAALYEAGQSGRLRSPDLEMMVQWRDVQQPNRAWGRQYHPGFDEAIAFLDASFKTASQEKHLRKIKRVRTRNSFVLTVCAAISALLVWYVYMQIESEAEISKQRMTIEGQELAEQARMAGVLGTHRRLKTLVTRINPDAEQIKEFAGEIESWQTALSCSEVPDDLLCPTLRLLLPAVVKYSNTRAFPVELDPIIQFSDALLADDLEGARQRLNEIRGPWRRVANATWEAWPNMRLAQARERRLIADLHAATLTRRDMTFQMKERTAGWRNGDNFNSSLFVEQEHHALASVLYGRILNGDDKATTEQLRLAHYYHELIAGKALRRSVAEEMMAHDLHSGHTTLVSNAFHAARLAQDREFLMLLVDEGPSETDEGNRHAEPLRFIRKKLRLNRDILIASYQPNGKLDKEAFGSNIHFSVACAAARDALKEHSCDEARPLHTTEVEMVLRIYLDPGNYDDAVEAASGGFGDMPVPPGLEASAPLKTPAALLAKLAASDLEILTPPSVFERVWNVVKDVLIYLGIILLWPAWDFSQWLRKRLGWPITFELRANPLRRFLAFCADLVVGAASGAMVALAAMAISWMALAHHRGGYRFVESNEAFLLHVGMVTFAITGLLYLVFRDAIRFKTARSLGKILFRLQPVAVNSEGALREASIRDSLKRNVPFAVVILVLGYQIATYDLSMAMLLSLLLGLWCLIELILMTVGDRRGLHDRWSGTRVIDARSEHAPQGV